MTAAPPTPRPKAPRSPDLFDWEDAPAMISWPVLIDTAKRWRYVILAAAGIGTALGLAAALSTKPSYTSRAQFFPEMQRPQSQASALAAQFGVSLGGSGGPDALSSSQIYPEVIRAKSFLTRVASAKYPASGKDSVTLIDLFGSGNGELERRERAIATLDRLIDVFPSPRTGVIALTVRTGDPQLSYEIGKRIVAEVELFNLERRQSRARAERRFIERRLTEIRAELLTTENELQRFLQRNADFQGAPDLNLSYQRLQREAGLQRQLYASLSQSYETAKIDEVRDTPVITVLSPPDFPAWPDPRGRARLLLLGLAGGAAIGGVLALALERRRIGRFATHAP